MERNERHLNDGTEEKVFSTVSGALAEAIGILIPANLPDNGGVSAQKL